MHATLLVFSPFSFLLKELEVNNNEDSYFPKEISIIIARLRSVRKFNLSIFLKNSREDTV